ncbi:hypothetical protein RIEGSTA812A_PEG_1139 [invertebrate metagenome]|uniref:Stringent starvation protein B n=1 Tax=invertebrate metagenome TaxID=1711999 RepID=A0A484H6B2_9ZZZZ
MLPVAERIYKLHYEKIVEGALRRVVREVLAVTEQQGLPGVHHFYITFRTRYPGVVIARHLLERYPDEMTIVLQNQFWGLEVGEGGFAVTLSFNRLNERLQVPFAAITAFADPSAKFGLQFNVESGMEPPSPVPYLPKEDTRALLGTSELDRSHEGDDRVGNVIALDAFRKKDREGGRH